MKGGSNWPPLRRKNTFKKPSYIRVKDTYFEERLRMAAFVLTGLKMRDKAYSELCQTSKIDHFTKIVNGF